MGAQRSEAIFSAVLGTPFGALGILSTGEALQEIVFLPATPPVAPRNSIAELTVEQIERYLVDPDAPFNIPLVPRGTAFRQRVWHAISAIPRGQCRSYGDLARKLNSAPRAVGQACGDNPYPLIIPCHRVVAANSIGGFAHESGGFLLDAKRWLLRHEGDLQLF